MPSVTLIVAKSFSNEFITSNVMSKTAETPTGHNREIIVWGA